MKAPADTGKSELAVHGGRKRIAEFKGQGPGKLGLEEFLALAEAWGFSRRMREKMKRLLAAEAAGLDPHLARYYNPRPSRAARLEAYARKLFGSRYALGVNSGTSALNTAYVACGIGPGDEVIVPAYTFFATAAAVVTARAIPVIAEVDDSLTIDPDDVERKISPRTKAIVPVHMGGNCCDMDRIMRIARARKLTVIEDNAQACGGKHRGRYLGTIGTMGCFSLSSFKITGAGEAGLVLTDNQWLYVRAQNQHDTAACWRPDRYARERRPGELFCGQNYRMDELSGAVNLVQLTKTRAQAKRYNTNTRRILSALEGFRRTKPRRSNDLEGDVGYNLVLLAGDAKAASGIVRALLAEGVPAAGRGDRAARDWHLYSYWEHILERKTATAEGCPFTCPYYAGPLPPYSQDMCPRTLDLLSRAVIVNVSQWWTAGDCRNVAAGINKVCRVLG